MHSTVWFASFLLKPSNDKVIFIRITKVKLSKIKLSNKIKADDFIFDGLTIVLLINANDHKSKHQITFQAGLLARGRSVLTSVANLGLSIFILLLVIAGNGVLACNFIILFYALIFDGLTIVIPINANDQKSLCHQ